MENQDFLSRLQELEEKVSRLEEKVSHHFTFFQYLTEQSFKRWLKAKKILDELSRKVNNVTEY